MKSISKYKLVETQLGKKWDDFILKSPNFTSFSCSYYLDSLSVKVKPFFCYKGEHLSAAILCINNIEGSKVVGHDYVIYDGLLYGDLSHLNKSQRYSEQFKIQEFVASELIKNFSDLKFSLHYSIKDIRPFLWVNYNTVGLKYNANIRYTSTIKLDSFEYEKPLEEIPVYNEASVARRQEIRYSRKRNVSTNQIFDPEKFIFYYEKTMGRQNIELNQQVLTTMRTLIENLHKKKKCVMMESSNRHGDLGSMAVFLLDNKRSYYLFGANDPKMRSEHTGTAVIWESLYKLKELGFDELDLEGVNSPNRGWFKMSFGGNLKTYYQIFTKK